MSTRVLVLPDNLANKIAAGEVVERPASVVKELVENSLDASASRITVEVRKGGKGLIKVSDNGEGMSQADALLSLERHATSKIGSEGDIYRIATLGFRGEALPSIAAVSRLRMVTKAADQLAGTALEVEGGKIISVKEEGCPQGTTVEVRDLFYNVRARLKFLKGEEIEFAHVAETVSRLALAHPEIQFQLYHNGRSVLDLPSTSSLGDRVADLIGKEAADRVVPFSLKEEGLGISGYASHPGFTRATSEAIHTFVNRRFVKDKLLNRAIWEGYRNLIAKERHPVCVLLLEIDPSQVDVNIHPTKREVRFRDAGFIYQKTLAAVRSALGPFGEGEHRQAGLKAWETIRARREQEEAKPQGAWEEALEGEEVAPLLSRGFFSSLEVIGQARNSFIVCQSASHLVLIDQHAAHERVIFERLKQGYQEKRIPSQSLLLPIQLEGTLKEAALINRHRQDLADLGFEIEPFGAKEFLIKAVPNILGPGDCRPLVLDLLEEFSGLGGAQGVEKIVDKVLMLMACHQVVQAHLPLDKKAIRFLLEELDRVDFSSSCPHGRPIWKEIPFQEIEKMFKR